jgi:molybdopterin-containing oxidoreductase family iron-sulfur binding subunit
MASKDSKNSFALMRESILAQNGKDYWRSVEEFVDAPEFEEFVKEEYPQHAEEWDDGLSRRNFVKVMGASLALAGLSGCVIQPPEKIVPYVKTPDGLLPGKPLFFATAMSLGGIATGLIAKSFDGRPIKIEGNPQHPGSLGGTDVLAQASLLDMYDPDRSKSILYRGSPSAWPNFMTALRTAVEENRKDGGAGVRFLTETVTSPTLIAQMKQVAAELPNSRWVQYEPVNCDNAMAGAKMAFGSPAHTVYKFEEAERILSLDADIFSGFNSRYKTDFGKGRAFSEEKKEINRLYVVETTVSLMGAKADHRLAVKPSQMTEIAKAIAKALGVAGANSTYDQNAAWIAAMAKDLLAHKGKSVVVAGDNQSPVVHALAHAMNGILENAGKTVVYTEPMQQFADKTQIDQLRELIADIDAKRVKMLIILGGNPLYNTPADLKITGERIKEIPFRVHLSTHADETSEHCHWHIAAKHYLEGWSDARAYDGTASIVQPLIAPLYDGKNVHEVVQLFFRENYDKKDYDIVKAYWQTQNITAGPDIFAAVPAGEHKEGPAGEHKETAGNKEASHSEPKAAPTPEAAKKEAPKPAVTPAPSPAAATPAAPAAAPANFEDNWRKAVHDGVIPGTALPAKTVAVNAAFLAQPTPVPASNGSLEISILPDPSVYDGRFANNGWLQEVPNPLNKITWENVAMISPNTARRLKINHGADNDEMAGGGQPIAFVNSKGGNLTSDLVTLKYQGGEISKPVPMWISPGQPDDVITIYMGYGRTRSGRVGTGIGYNAFEVRRSDSMDWGTGEITATGEQGMVASTQTHFTMEGRDLLRTWDVEEFEKDPTIGHQHDEAPKSFYEPAAQEYEKQYKLNHKWGMTIDLNSCIGCNACVIACQAENNIPVVGKEQIERSREMHWLRIDAYFAGDDLSKPDGPYFQPILCQQCEQAPCEVVCPVTATAHSAEGLNDMVYNRCVGTRYCSNNCPYKVRRFNFMLYQDWDTPQYKLMRNPEVTIRSRGIMEKCTYCTQRIAAARIEAEKDARKIADGEVLTACQSACPTNAFVFGDLNDANSQVSKMKKDHRNYILLNELNTQPRTTYLAGLKNQNKEMPDYKAPKTADHGAKKPEAGKAEGH